MNEARDFRPGEVVTWFRSLGTNNRKLARTEARVVRITPSRLHLEFEPAPGLRAIRYVAFEQVEKRRAS